MPKQTNVFSSSYLENQAELSKLRNQKEINNNLDTNEKTQLNSIIIELNRLRGEKFYQAAYLLGEIYDNNDFDMVDEGLARHYYLQAVSSQNLLIKVQALKSLGTSYWKEAKKLENIQYKNFAESIKDLKKQALDRFDQAQTYLNSEQMKTEPKETIETFKKNIENNIYKLLGEVRKVPKKSTSMESKLPNSFTKFMKKHLNFSEEQQQSFLEYINKPKIEASESKKRSEQEFPEKVLEHPASNTTEPPAETSEIMEKFEQKLPELVTDSLPPPLPSTEPPSTPEPETKKDKKEIEKPKSPKTWNFLGSNAPKPEAPKRTWNLPSSPAKKETEETEEEKKAKAEYDAKFPTSKH